MSINIGIVGANGRMGLEIRELISESKDFKFCGGVARSSDSEQIVENIESLNTNFDVLIDFSLPELSEKVFSWVEKHGVGLVSGVTGLNKSHFSRIDEISQKSAILWAPNMSLGVQLIHELIPKLDAVRDYDFQITDIHHRNKKDSPSGTAAFLQKQLQTSIKPDAPDPISMRVGGVFGVHKISAFGPEETIEISHEALNRRVFARGALVAAKWISSRTPGLYCMKDVLGL